MNQYDHREGLCISFFKNNSSVSRDPNKLVIVVVEEPKHTTINGFASRNAKENFRYFNMYVLFLMNIAFVYAVTCH
jgi:hypothetical protein